MENLTDKLYFDMSTFGKSKIISEKLLSNLKCSIEAKSELISDLSAVDEYAKAVEAVINSYESGGRLYIAGNGGSASDAQHLAAEFISKLSRPRGPLPAEALTVDSSIITAIANDFGYEFVFSRQLEAKANANDIFLGLTTSGSSPNIIQALKICKSLGVVTIVFTGHDGGACKALADHCVIAPGNSTALIQELHIVLYHTLCEIVETNMFFGRI
jgi:D-sedoheptulose 7-phosphate isomerase